MANIVRNGGASNTTDWTNPTIGLAKYWSQDHVAGTRAFSIVTGNGFTGNAQRFEFTYTSQNGSGILQSSSDFIESPTAPYKHYALSFKYRMTDTSSDDQGVYIQIHYADHSWDNIASFIENTGNAISASCSFNSAAGKDIEYLVFAISCGANQTSWLELDEVDMQEYTVPTNTSKVMVNGTWETIDYSNSKIMVNGTWETVSGIKLRNSGVWETIY